MPKAPIEVTMFMQAQRFHRSSQFLRSEPSIENARNYALPSVYLAYTAIEICLKCLIVMHNGQESHGHNLRQLFLQLPQPLRARIIKGWELHLEKIESDLAFGEQSTGLVAPRDLDSALAAATSSYENSRYLWDSTGNEMFILIDFPDVLIPIAKDIGLERSRASSRSG